MITFELEDGTFLSHFFTDVGNGTFSALLQTGDEIIGAGVALQVECPNRRPS